MGEWFHILLTSALVAVERSALPLGPFMPGEGALGTYRIRRWEGLRTGLNDVERRYILLLPKLDPSEVQPVACSDTDCAIPADIYIYIIM
jgi:hypothetical protein